MIVVHRGLGDQTLFAFLTELRFAYFIRLRGNIRVTDAPDETRCVADWVGRA